MVTPPPDRHHGRCQSSRCSQTSSHPPTSICRGEVFFAQTSAIGGAYPPVYFCPSPFVARAKNISPLQLRLLPRRQIATMGAVNHQYVRKPLRISDHPFVGAKYFSPGHRRFVANNRLTISAPHHLWRGRKIFRPYVRNWWRLSACLFFPIAICGMGEKYFTPAFDTGTPHQPQLFKSLPTSRLWAACSARAQNISPGQPSQLDPHTNILHINN